MRRALVVVLASCGASGSQSDAGADATVDATSDAPSIDSSANEGGSDGEADSAQGIACLVPADCIDGGDSGVVCCGTAVTIGSIPNCVTTDFSSQCSTPGACTSAIDSNECGTDTIRLCAHSSDCTEPSYSACCGTDAGLPFCIDPMVAAFLHMQCL